MSNLSTLPLAVLQAQRAQALGPYGAGPQSGFATPGGAPMGLPGQAVGGSRVPGQSTVPDTKLPPTPPPPNIDATGALDMGSASAADHIGRGAGGGAGLDFANLGGIGGGMGILNTPTDYDKNMALAQAGFAAMGSGSPWGGVAIGQGMTAGLKALQERQAQRAEAAIRLQQLRVEQTKAQLEGMSSLIPYMTNDQINAYMGQRGVPGGAAGTTLSVPSSAPAGGGGAPSAAPAPGGAINSSIIPSDVVTSAVGDLRNYPVGSPRYSSALATLEAAAKYDPRIQRALAVAGVGKINPSQGEVLTPTSLPAGGGGGGSKTAPSATPPPPVAAPPSASSPAGGGATTPPVAKTPIDLIPTADPLPQPGTVGQRDQVAEYGKKLGAMPDAIDQKADQAKQANYLLGQMRDESQSWDMGKGAETVGKAKAYLLGVNNMLPESLQFDKNSPWMKQVQESTGDIQAFNKNAMELARQVVRATSSRAAYQEMQMIQTALPSAGMTQGGFTQIAAQLEGANDYALAQQQAKDLWIKKNGPNMNGFEGWFNKTVDPGVFLLNRLSPEDRAATISKIEANPTGKAALARLIQQTMAAKSLGLLGAQ